VGVAGETISLRDWFEERFEGLEHAIGRVEKKLDCVSELQVRVAVLETRQKWVFTGLGVVIVAVVGVLLERLLALI